MGLTLTRLLRIFERSLLMICICSRVFYLGNYEGELVSSKSTRPSTVQGLMLILKFERSVEVVMSDWVIISEDGDG